ncbi:MAG: oxidoreductase [Hydrogenophaga sp.]|nr:oxidoreductase [Comamonadaceae bacterium]MBS4037809.1 oxidoreductase [Hydrogenophaga sp.]
MFGETAEFEGRVQPRFVKLDAARVQTVDVAGARALVAHVRGLARRQGIDIDAALRPPPPEPVTCCGRGCNGCVWEGFHNALAHWRDEALQKLAAG